MKDKIGIVGLGYVGLPLALLASKKGYEVIGFDLDSKKVDLIQARKDPIGDEYIQRAIKETKLFATSDNSELGACSIIIICVPTPVKDGYIPDLEPLKGALSLVAKQNLKNKLIIIESTINPGVCDEVAIPLLEEISKLKVNKEFYVSHCPERINPGDPKWNVSNIPRVAGSSNEEGLKKTTSFYESIIDAQIKPMATIKEAEACKVVENSFRDINIAFVNELAMSFTKLGINVKNVIDGAATKPFAFIAHYPSVGVGGHCIPVDPYYLIEYAKGYGFNHEFLSLARTINNGMPEFTVERLIDGLSEADIKPQNAKVLVLGLSYKANVADDRESPSYKVIKILDNRGITYETYDPYIIDRSSFKHLNDGLTFANSVIIATNHNEFINIPFHDYGIQVVVDGKNCLKQRELIQNRIIYRGIGT